MLRSSESETEILLGNKQLLGIFFVVAILLGIAFAGGYMVGRGNSGKRTAETPASASSETATPAAQGPAGETHSVPAENSSEASGDSASTHTASPAGAEETPLGARKKGTSSALKSVPASSTSSERNGSDFAPQSGQQFLQVAAVGRDEAAAIADVLHKKGFSAHSVAKPSNPKIFRVLIGPIHDAGDLASTRDALHRTGFRDVIVQRY